MKNILLLLFFSFMSLSLFSQNLIEKDSLKIKSKIFNKTNSYEAVWDQGLPILLEDENIMNLIKKIDDKSIDDVNKMTDDQVRLYRELGVEFYNKGLYQEADFYLSKIKNYSEKKGVKLKEVFRDSEYYNNLSQIRKEIKEELDKEYKLSTEELNSSLSLDELQSLKKDTEFLKSLPNSFDNLSKEDLNNLSKKIDNQIKKLIKERDNLVENNGSKELIDSKNTNIKSLKKEKQVIDLSIDKEVLKEEKGLIKKWLWITASIIALLVLSILSILQRKTIRIQDAEIEKQIQDINKKNTYLEHAARIIRHDMHSGINTYIPRGINSLEKRLNPDEIKNLKIDVSVKMIKEGLNHTQRVYKSVYEFTNLVKQNVVLEKSEINLKELIEKNIINTSYLTQVEISDLPISNVNETLFWNAIDNIIKNGLKYNKSENKLVKIYLEDNSIIIEDNGIGLSKNKFDKILKLSNNSNDESGLGLNITNAILVEHGFELDCEQVKTGTKMKIKL